MVWKLENSMVRLMAAMMACFEADRMADSPVILTVLRKDGYLVGMWVGILVEMKENCQAKQKKLSKQLENRLTKQATY